MGKRLELVQEEKTLWRVVKSGVTIAQLYLNHIQETEKVTVSRSIEPKDRLEVLRLALSHAVQYMRARDLLDQGLEYRSRGEFDRTTGAGDPVSKSRQVMTFSKIPPVVQKASEKDVRRGLEGWGIVVIDKADLRTPEDIVRKVTTSLHPRVSSESHRRPGSDKFSVTFKVRGGVFTFWRLYHGRESPPSDHPERHGKKQLFMVNGASDAALQAGVIDSVHAPKGSIPPRYVGLGSWGGCTHPYRAQGSEFTVRLRIPYLLGNAGEQQLKDMLLAALGKSKKYISVSPFGS